MDDRLVRVLELLTLLRANLLTANIGYEKEEDILYHVFRSGAETQSIYHKDGLYHFKNKADAKLALFFEHFYFYDFRVKPDYTQEFFQRFGFSEPDIDSIQQLLYLIYESHQIGQKSFDDELKSIKSISPIVYHCLSALLHSRSMTRGMIDAISHFNALLRYLPLSIFYALNGRAYFFHLYYHVVGKKKFQEIIESGNKGQILESKYMQYCMGNFRLAREKKPSNPIIDMFQGAVEVHLMHNDGVEKLKRVLDVINPDAQYISKLLIARYYYNVEDYKNALKYTLILADKDVKFYRQILEIYVAMRDENGFKDTVSQLLQESHYEFIVISRETQFTGSINHTCIFIHVPMDEGVWLNSKQNYEQSIAQHFEKIPKHFSRLDPQGFMQGFLLRPAQ